MFDTYTPLCECSGFQRASKGEGGGGDKAPGFKSSALPIVEYLFPI